MEVESTALVRYLTSLEWQQLNLQDSAVNLESDVLKSMVVLEAVFEHTRKKLAPHLSSRLDCMFVWPTWELADTFRQHYFPDGVIHHCKVQGEAVELDG